MKLTKRRGVRISLLILVIFIIVGIAVSIVVFNKNNHRTYASSSLSFSFDGAAAGLAPNGYAFDVNDISDEEVLTKALEEAGLSDRYSVSEIAPSLVVSGVFPEDLVSRMTSHASFTDSSASQQLALSDYHSTVYSVVLYDDFDPSISSTELSGLLEQILNAYRDYFARTHANGTSGEIDIESLDTYDYFQQLEILNNRLKQSMDYAGEMAEREPDPILEGKSFSDVSLQISRLMTSDLARLNATMTMNSLSKDLDRLKEQYSFELMELQNQIRIEKLRLQKLDELIATYGKSGIIYLSTSDTLNQVDTKSSKVYDSLVDLRNEVSDKIASLNTQISTYEKKLEEIENGEEKPAAMDAASAENGSGDTELTKEETEQLAGEVTTLSEASYDQQKAVLETGISRLVDKANRAIGTLSEMVRIYNEQEINEFTVRQAGVKYKTPSIISTAFVKTLIKTAGPFVALGLILSLILVVIRRKKGIVK